MPRTKAIAIQNLRNAQAGLDKKSKSKMKKKVAAADTTSEVQKRKPHRWRPGTVAQREIRKFQKTTKNVLPRSPVKRIVKALLAEYSTNGDARMTRNAFESLYEMVSAVATDALAAAERVRVSENKVQSIRSRHLRVGRGLIGVHCLSDSQIPLEFTLRSRPKSERKIIGKPVESVVEKKEVDSDADKSD